MVQVAAARVRGTLMVPMMIAALSPVALRLRLLRRVAVATALVLFAAV